MKRYYFKNVQHRARLNAKGGQAMIIAVLFFLTISVVFTVGVMLPILDEMRIASNLVLSKSSYYASESGIEDAGYRLKDGLAIPTPVNGISTDTVYVNNATASTTITAVAGGEQLNSTGDQENLYRKIQMTLASGSGAAFQYGVQVGTGGITMAGSSGLSGNVYSNGPIIGSNSTIIAGDAISAGASGLIEGTSQYNQIPIQGNAYAHTISGASITKNAYYQAISGSTVGGTSYPGSTDQPAATLPISDSQISAWETEAQNGGVITTPCTYTIGGVSNVTLGPVKINCSLDITNSAVVTLDGPVWVSGNVTIEGAAIVKISPSLGATSVPIIADNQANETSSSEITMTDSGQLLGSGNSKSFIVLISQNNSAQNGGSAVAINADGAASGSYMLYAGHGQITLGGSASLKEVTAYLLSLSGTAQVSYSSGLANLNFSSGSSGGYTVSSWGETQ